MFTALKALGGLIAAAVVACFRSVKRTVRRISQMLGLGSEEAGDDETAMPDLLSPDQPPPVLPEHME